MTNSEGGREENRNKRRRVKRKWRYWKRKRGRMNEVVKIQKIVWEREL